MKKALWLGALATIILLVACGKTADPAEVLRRFLAAVANPASAGNDDARALFVLRRVALQRIWGLSALKLGVQ